MSAVIKHKETSEILGTLTSLNEVTDFRLHNMFLPFVERHGYLVYFDETKQTWGIANPQKYTIHEETKHTESVFEKPITEVEVE